MDTPPTTVAKVSTIAILPTVERSFVARVVEVFMVTVHLLVDGVRFDAGRPRP